MIVFANILINSHFLFSVKSKWFLLQWKKKQKKYIDFFLNVLEWTESLNFNTAIWFSQKSKDIHFGQLELTASGSKNAEKENKKISQRTKIHSKFKLKFLK